MKQARMFCVSICILALACKTQSRTASLKDVTANPQGGLTLQIDPSSGKLLIVKSASVNGDLVMDFNVASMPIDTLLAQIEAPAGSGAQTSSALSLADGSSQSVGVDLGYLVGNQTLIPLDPSAFSFPVAPDPSEFAKIDPALLSNDSGSPAVEAAIRDSKGAVVARGSLSVDDLMTSYLVAAARGTLVESLPAPASSNNGTQLLDAESDYNSANSGYVASCTAALGAIPQIDCFGVGQVVPVQINGVDLDWQSAGPKTKCDKPVLLGLGHDGQCIPNSRVGSFIGSAVPRPGAAAGDKTQWVFACRRYFARAVDDVHFDDVNMIGYNPNTGATCFFNSRLAVPGGLPVADSDKKSIVPVPGSPGSVAFWTPAFPVPNTKSSVAGINCVSCHDGDAFIHSPWVDQLKVVPFNYDKYPEYPYFAAVFADDPRTTKTWTVVQLAQDGSDGCTLCHRIGRGTGSRGFHLYAAGQANPGYAAQITAGDYHWMPPKKALDDDLKASAAVVAGCLVKDSKCLFEPIARFDSPATP